MKFLQQLGQQLGSTGFYATDTYSAGQLTLVLLQLPDSPLLQGDYFFGPLEEKYAFLSKSQLLVVSVQQLQSQRGFQLLHLPAECWLGDVQQVGCPRDTAGLSNGYIVF